MFLWHARPSVRLAWVSEPATETVGDVLIKQRLHNEIRNDATIIGMAFSGH